MNPWLDQLRAELWAEHHWEDTWCRTYGVGLYAGISEWWRAEIRVGNPWFKG